MKQVEGLLAQGRLAAEGTSCLHFTLAILLDKQGRYDEAFSHYRRGNDLKRELFRQYGRAYDPEGHRRLIDLLIATFDRSFFDGVQSFGVDSELPVFIVGMPRSGTTLVQQILASHPQIFAAGEIRDLEQILSAPPQSGGIFSSYPVYMSSATRQAIRIMSERYLERLGKLGGQAQRVVDKMPHNYLHLGSIFALFPRARIIHCRREAMDVCLSCYCQNFKWLNYASSLADLGFHYREYERLMAHWRQVLPLRMYEVQYEDLVARSEPVIRDLIAFCGLDWSASCLDFHRNPRAVRTASKLQVRRPVYASSVGRWQRYASHLGPLRDTLGHAAPARSSSSTPSAVRRVDLLFATRPDALAPAAAIVSPNLPDLDSLAANLVPPRREH